MSRCKLRTPWPIHFKFHRVIEIDGFTVCILYGEISIFIPELWDFIHQIVGDFSYVALSIENPLANSLQTSHSYWN
jgi:hypothetical protein